MNETKKHIFLPGLTTTKGSDWREKVKEIDALRIKEIALFPTFLNDLSEREELYVLLERTSLRRIPHVHATDNVLEWELDYYIKRFQTKVFNIHSNETTEKLLGATKHKDKIYVETTDDIDELFLKNLRNSAGLCLDAAHCADKGFLEYCEGFEKIPELLQKYPVGCAHISVVKNDPIEYIHYLTKKKILNWSNHWFDDPSQLEYVRKYVKYLPKYVSIELENPFAEQLEVAKHLERIINETESNLEYVE